MVAVDPSSPFSGGALLGDRVRMQRHATDDGRVHPLAGHARPARAGCRARRRRRWRCSTPPGFPLIFVETVGAGQAEVDVADAADAVVVVTAPGLGDEVQALKAGLLEIADVLVVNKGDRDGADRALADLTTMLELAARPSRPGEPPRAAPALVRASAATGAGVGGRRGGARRAPGARPRRRAAPAPPSGGASNHGAGRRAGARRGRGRPRHRRGARAAGVDDRQVAARTLDPWSAAEALDNRREVK